MENTKYKIVNAYGPNKDSKYCTINIDYTTLNTCIQDVEKGIKAYNKRLCKRISSSSENEYILSDDELLGGDNVGNSSTGI